MLTTKTLCQALADDFECKVFCPEGHERKAWPFVSMFAAEAALARCGACECHIDLTAWSLTKPEPPFVPIASPEEWIAAVRADPNVVAWHRNGRRFVNRLDSLICITDDGGDLIWHLGGIDLSNLTLVPPKDGGS